MGELAAVLDQVWDVFVLVVGASIVWVGGCWFWLLSSCRWLCREECRLGPRECLLRRRRRR